MSPDTLIHRYLTGQASEAEVRELDRLLADDPKLRRKLIFEAGNDAALREIALERVAQPAADEKVLSPNFRPAALALAACAAVALAVIALPRLRQPDPVATLVSNEDAAWESALPTTPGSRLGPGRLTLKAGMSTLRFASGAELVLEAPAELELIDPMRARLLSGSAMLDVPESAIGFVMETPDGYAVDYGTQFSVRVDEHRQRSDFELIRGEIAVHHPHTGKQVRLTRAGRMVSVSKQALVVGLAGSTEPAEESSPRVLRLRTNGRFGSVRSGTGKRAPRREVLIARRNNSGDSNAHSFFAFDLSKVDFDQVESVELLLNQVPSRGGSAARLPRINRFAVHGLTNAAKADWSSDCTWETAPQPEDGELLGRFEIPRSRKRGSCRVSTPALLAFLKARQGGEATLILSRETKFLIGVGAGKGMTHTFASDAHPEAVGPLLQFKLKTQAD